MAGYIYSVAQAARVLGVKQPVVRAWIAEGKLEAAHLSARVTRIHEDSIRAFWTSTGARLGELPAPESLDGRANVTRRRNPKPGKLRRFVALYCARPGSVHGREEIEARGMGEAMMVARGTMKGLTAQIISNATETLVIGEGMDEAAEIERAFARWRAEAEKAGEKR